MTILITGATGMVGSGVLSKLAAAHPAARFMVLVRSPARWQALAPLLGDTAERVTPIRGDLRLPSLGINPEQLRQLTGSLHSIIHCAGDVSFSRPLAESRVTNTHGTRRVLELAWSTRVQNFSYISTAFVAGRRTGLIGSDLVRPRDGWVNAYEQSKFEAEMLVRDSGLPWTIFRPSIIACDDDSGRVSQYNSLHRALFLCYNGLASLMPGAEDTPVDAVTADYVSSAIAELALLPESREQTYHLCAGGGAIPLGELLDRSFELWSRDVDWSRRATPRPALTDLGTYRLFTSAVDETGDTRLRGITRALGHFAPQLCYGKLFDTRSTDAALGYAAPPTSTLWNPMINQLLLEHWNAVRSVA